MHYCCANIAHDHIAMNERRTQKMFLVITPTLKNFLHPSTVDRFQCLKIIASLWNWNIPADKNVHRLLSHATSQQELCLSQRYVQDQWQPSDLCSDVVHLFFNLTSEFHWFCIIFFLFLVFAYEKNKIYCMFPNFLQFSKKSSFASLEACRVVSQLHSIKKFFLINKIRCNSLHKSL